MQAARFNEGPEFEPNRQTKRTFWWKSPLWLQHILLSWQQGARPRRRTRCSKMDYDCALRSQCLQMLADLWQTRRSPVEDAPGYSAGWATSRASEGSSHYTVTLNLATGEPSELPDVAHPAEPPGASSIGAIGGSAKDLPASEGIEFSGRGCSPSCCNGCAFWDELLVAMTAIYAVTKVETSAKRSFWSVNLIPMQDLPDLMKVWNSNQIDRLKGPFGKSLHFNRNVYYSHGNSLQTCF